MDNNYNEYSVVANGSESELNKLRVENQALQALLKKHLLEIALQNEEDDTTASSTGQNLQKKTNITTPGIFPTHTAPK